MSTELDIRCTDTCECVTVKWFIEPVYGNVAKACFTLDNKPTNLYLIYVVSSKVYNIFSAVGVDICQLLCWQAVTSKWQAWSCLTCPGLQFDGTTHIQVKESDPGRYGGDDSLEEVDIMVPLVFGWLASPSPLSSI